jgi:hypothetical protein
LKSKGVGRIKAGCACKSRDFFTEGNEGNEVGGELMRGTGLFNYGFGNGEFLAGGLGGLGNYL